MDQILFLASPPSSSEAVTTSLFIAWLAKLIDFSGPSKGGVGCSFCLRFSALIYVTVFCCLLCVALFPLCSCCFADSLYFIALRATSQCLSLRFVVLFQLSVLCSGLFCNYLFWCVSQFMWAICHLRFGGFLRRKMWGVDFSWESDESGVAPVFARMWFFYFGFCHAK